MKLGGLVFRLFCLCAFGLAAQVPVWAAGPGPYKAIAFDAFAVLDPRPVAELAVKLFPDKGAALAADWRERQFEYCWLRACGQKYEDFYEVTEDALLFAARKQGLELSREQQAALMAATLNLQPWPDAVPALGALKKAGFHLAILSNFSPRMMGAFLRNRDLSGLFEKVISTAAVESYKPDPKAYRLGADAFHLKPREILFVPFAGWDQAGAKWFGYPTFWVNRLHAPVEVLAAEPDGMGADLGDLLAFVGLAK